MKTVVNQSRTQYNEAVINDKFYQFSKDMGFESITCRAYRPKTKGKVENLAKVTERLRVYNYEFDSIDDLDELILKLNVDLNNEVSQATFETPISRFQKEKEHLNPLPDQRILDMVINRPVTRKVSKESMVVYKRHKYSVHPKHIGKIIEIKLISNKLYFYYNSLLIKSHELSDKIFNYERSDMIEILKSDAFNHKSLEEIEAFVDKNIDIYDKISGGKQ